MGFFSGKNAADEAMPYLANIESKGAQYLDPYIQQGQQATDTTMPQYQQMAQHPDEMLAELFKDYDPSAGFQFNQDRMMGILKNNAAAGGYSGTDYDQYKQGEMLQGLQAQDQFDWIDRALGIQDRGMQGLSGFRDQGFQAGTNMADIGTQQLSSQGGAAYQGQSQKNQNKNELLKSVMQMLGAAMGRDKKVSIF